MSKRKYRIVDLFINKGLRQKHIGNIFNMSTSKVDRLLIKWKIKNKVHRKTKPKW